MKKYAINELVYDFDLYPRGSVDSHHVGEIAAAIQAGSELPPIVIDKKTKRIVDGFHRSKAYRRVYGDDYEIMCIEKTYKSEKDLFLDSMRYNASHGRALTQHDKVHCLIMAEKFKIEPELLGQALNITVGRIGQLTTERVGLIGKAPVALKRTVRHMAGQQLTQVQSDANKKLSGMNQSFYVNQVITLIESDMLDLDDQNLMETLGRLYDLIGGIAKKAA